MAFNKNMQKLLGLIGDMGENGGAEDKAPWGRKKPSTPASVTRWEKAVTAVNSLSKQIAKIDPDGIDVYCFSGRGVQRYEGIADPDALANIVTEIQPEGACRMGQALEIALNDSKARFAEGRKPQSFLVLTAGLPDDQGNAINYLKRAVVEQKDHLSITFVQVGDDPQAEAFLRHIDNDLTHQVGGQTIDIIDTVKDEDLVNAMLELQDPKWKTGALVGGLIGMVGGMALGAGGAHLIDQHFAKKRTAGWNGNWEVLIQPGDQPTGVILQITDSMKGELAIQGYPEDDSCGQRSEAGSYEEHPGDGAGVPASYSIRRQVIGSGGEVRTCSKGCGRAPFKTYPTCCTHCKGERGPHARDCRRRRVQPRRGQYVTGTVVDEHTIEWSDNTTWREVARQGTSWVKLGGGAAVGGVVGGAAGGAIGALVQKKFFNKAHSKTPSDYVILLDCSNAMSVLDTGKGYLERAIPREELTKGAVGSDVFRAAMAPVGDEGYPA